MQSAVPTSSPEGAHAPCAALGACCAVLAALRRYIQVVRHCNHFCGFCSNPTTPYTHDFESMRVLVDDFVARGYFGVILTGGEPSLHPELPAICRYASEAGLHVRMITNGTRMADRKFAQAMAEAGLKLVYVSIYSVIEALEDSLRGTPGTGTDRCLSRTRWVSERRRSRPGPTTTRQNHRVEQRSRAWSIWQSSPRYPAGVSQRSSQTLDIEHHTHVTVTIFADEYKRAERVKLQSPNKKKNAMPRNARIPQVDRTDKRLMMIGQLITEVVEERMGGERGWMETSQAELCVVADALWLREEQRLEAARTDAARIIVDGEPYRRMAQPSSRLYHGRWGAHRIEEPLYRREGVRNGPTLRPLDRVIGVVDGSLLPELALALGSLCAVQTSREVEETLTRLGFRPPSRATIPHRSPPGGLRCGSRSPPMLGVHDLSRSARGS
ncbi:radical SAM protein [Pseudenhygromyxa sp. WMMC2535]|uniref:radical SAM protein n=1 Tax=Pseudenhygromyxa sp. WMMC2535 TaxID=2712867 RepID=UPI001595AAF8|nr:radical SAM protein [Pseudenhygromyxa sp. WMMC2535]NVB39483.1 radical SAM protein [Pseudenhygromyxa sp. WMMC2535]